MSPELKIRRHGYHLMTLASVGTLVVAAAGLAWVLLVLAASPAVLAAWERFDLTPEAAARLEAGTRGLLVLAAVLSTLAYLLPLAAVRRTGKALHAHPALSAPVARAFMHLAHSLPLSALCSLAADLVAAWALSSPGAVQLRISFGANPYYFLLACLCLYSVAHLLHLAVQAAEDARSII